MFSKTITLPSKSTPGVSFTFRRLGLAPRAEIDFETVDLRQRQREIQALYPAQSAEEDRISEALAAARKKAYSVPEDQVEQVLIGEVVPIAAQLAAAAAPEVRAQRAKLDVEYAAVEQRVKVRWLSAGLVSIAGGEVDGMTAEELADYGPPELGAEIADAIISGARLGASETKNSSSPGTSSGQVDGATIDSTAPAANATEISSAATVSPATPNL